MKQGLFGGTFNPVHNGHIKVICHVKKEFGLDKIHVIPSAVPPHKTAVNLASAKDRLEMVRCSIKSVPGLAASDIELKRKGPSFTIDTINQFMDKFRKTPDNKLQCHIDQTSSQAYTHKETLKPELYLIMGSDAFFDITTWKKNMEIFKLIPVVVMLRPCQTKRLNNVACFIKNMISKNYIYNESTGSFFNPAMMDIHICKVPEVELSSTLIRKRVQQHLSINSMVPQCVEKIIRKKGLYL